MRSLNRNKRQIWYALRTGETVDLDEYGNETSESTPTYGEAVALMCNISAALGEDVVQAFGSFAGYSRVICVADTSCPIDEESIIWFGGYVESRLDSMRLDEAKLDGLSENHNYIVVRKADSKNGVLYALQEVSVA